jgi:glycosyltransferase involved in cell wall biosynthesis
MTGAEPLVSILTPSLNQGRFLGDCLDSVERQHYRPLEHVVFDACSTDETPSVLGRAGPHVRWTAEPDTGQANALNKAFAASRGEIVGWLNSDDAYVDRRAVAAAVEAFRSDPSAGVVFGHALLVNEANRVLQVHPALPFALSAYRLMHYVIQPAVFFRRELLEREPYFVDERWRYVIDRELFLRLAGRGTRFRRLGCVVAGDRHQRNRKVLEPAFLDEARAFDETLGVDSRTTLRARALRVGVRLSGSALAATLPRRIEPAIDLDVPPLLERVRLQTITRRRRMSFT